MSHPLQTRAEPRGRGGPRRRWLIGVALAVSFAAGGVAVPVIAASAQDGAMHHMMGKGHGDMRAMAMNHLDSLLTQVDATADQKAKIKSILGTAFASMGDMHAKMGGMHHELHAILAAPTIDRDALEKLRLARVADFDQASKTMTKAFADAAEVLRPEQRAKLASLMAEHHPPS